MSTDRVYLSNKNSKLEISSIRLQGLCDSPLISSGIRINASATTDAVEIPPLAIVHQVALWASATALASVSVNVGVASTVDKFIDGVTDLAANDIVFSGLAGTVAADPVGGAYFASGGVIQLSVDGGATMDSTVKVLVWYTGTS